MLTRLFLHVSQFYKCSTSYEISSGKTTFEHTYMVLSLTATDVVYFFPYATSWYSDATLLALDQNVISSFLSYNQHLISKESSVEISRHHVEHWAMLPNSSLKPGFSFQKESHVTRRHKDTKA